MPTAFALHSSSLEARMAKKAAKKTGGSKAGGARGSAKKTAARKGAAKRELIDTSSDKRFVRRRAAGTFKESDDVGRSLSADSRKKARTKVKPGQGDKGDR